MKKISIGISLTLVIAFTFILSACQPNALGKEDTTPTVAESTEASGFVELSNLSGETQDQEFTCTAVAKQGDHPSYALEGDHVLSVEDPAITLILYSDFACDMCNSLYQITQAILLNYPGDIEFIYRYFPLPDMENQEELTAANPKSLIAIQAAEAASNQNYFWEMYALLNDNYDTWIEYDEQTFTDWILTQVASIDELDEAQFETDMFSEKIVNIASTSMENAIKAGVTYIPFLGIDDSAIPGDYYEYNSLNQSLGQVIALTRLEDIQYDECPEMTIDTNKDYYAKVTTDIGEFTIHLFDDVAPFTVNSFIFLAENNWYDDVYFHRIEPGFVAQVGDPTGTGMGNPGYLYSLEVSDDLTFDRAGLVAMANSGPNSNGSQFFITYDATPHLDGSYTIFGEVVDGMDVVEALQDTALEDAENTYYAIFIRDIEIIEK